MREETLAAFRRRWNGSGTTGIIKFHDICGDNIRLNRTRTAAYRTSGFSHGLSFSNCPLLPGQLFLIEITDAQDGWSGHLRVGVTQQNPSDLKPVPEMVIPDMTVPNTKTDQGHSTPFQRTWATAITKFHNRVPGKQKEVISRDKQVVNEEIFVAFANQRISLSELFFYGSAKFTFSSSGPRFPDFGQSVFIGSRIGIILAPVHDFTGAEISDNDEDGRNCDIKSYTKCNMHIIINGEDQGPCATDIPLDKPLFVLVDVYSVTKRVNIVKMTSLGTLKDLCRDVIRSRVRGFKECDQLPLPKTMQRFCQYR